MKKNLPLLFLFFSFTLSAQLNLTLQDQTSLTVLSTDDVVIAKGTLKNESDQEVVVQWKRNIVEITDGWDTSVCDKNNCYNPPIGETSDEDPEKPMNLRIAAGESSNFDIYIYPNGLEGAAIVELTGTDVANPENTVTGRYTFNQPTTSTSSFNLNRSEIKVYPNPTTSYISLTEEENVERLVIYNIVGRRVKLFNANYSNRYNVMDLPSGMYLVRLMGANDQTIKTVRLSKKNGA